MARADLSEVRRAFEEELRDRGWTRADLRRATAIDGQKPLERGTVEDACRGARFPSIPNQARFEKVLGWRSGWMVLLREGVPLRQLKLAAGETLPHSERLRPEIMAVLAQARDFEIEAELLRRGLM